jgi:hypothetical protein
VLALVDKDLGSISIKFKHAVPQKLAHLAERYYLKHKHSITAEFIELLTLRAASYREQATSVEGMLKPIQGEPHHFLFVPSEMEESVLPLKFKRNNLSEF